MKALEPNYKKLRQEHMDEKRRDIQEEVSKSYMQNRIMFVVNSDKIYRISSPVFQASCVLLLYIYSCYGNKTSHG